MIGQADRAGLHRLAGLGQRGGEHERAAHHARHPVTDAGEQVVLGRRRIDQRADELEVLGRPDLALQVERDLEEPAVGVDLGGVGEQRGVAPLEPVGHRHPRRDLRRPALLHPLLAPLEPLLERRLDAALEHRLVQRLGALGREADVVVELERLPRLAGVGELVGIGGGVEGGDRDLVGADVVGVRVAAELVVGRHDVRAEAADLLRPAARRPRRAARGRSSPRAAAAAGRPRAGRSRRSRASAGARRGSRGRGPSRRGGSRRCCPRCPCGPSAPG